MTKHSLRKLILIALAVSAVGSLLFVLRKPEPIAASRYVEPDRLFEAIVANVRHCPELEVIVDIDHSRLGAQAGSPMPPAHVLIWSDPILEASILSLNPVAAIDLPLRILAYEDQATGNAAVIFNSSVRGFFWFYTRECCPTGQKTTSSLVVRHEKATCSVYEPSNPTA